MDPYKRLQVVINTGFILKASEISFHENFLYSINFKLSRSWVTQPWIYPGYVNFCIVKMITVENIFKLDIFPVLTLKVEFLSVLYD